MGERRTTDKVKVPRPRRPLFKEDPMPLIQDFACPATAKSSLNGDCQAETSGKFLNMVLGLRSPRAWFRCRCGMKFQAQIKELASAPKPSA
jgi:hypothetical protein